MVAQPQQAGIQSAALEPRLRPNSAARRIQEVSRGEEFVFAADSETRRAISPASKQHAEEVSAIQQPAARAVSLSMAVEQQGGTSEADSNEVLVV